jgi:exonuclease III
MLFCNVRSIRNKIEELQQLIQDYSIDIFIFQETFLTNKTIIDFNGYSIFSHTHPSNYPRGGTIIGFKNNLNYSQVIFNRSNNTEYGKCRFEYKQQKINLYSIYNHPNDKLDIRKFSEIINQKEPYLIIGDLNAKHKLLYSSSTNSNGRLLFDFLMETDCIMLNDKTPTHYTNRYTSRDILDYAFRSHAFTYHISK